VQMQCARERMWGHGCVAHQRGRVGKLSVCGGLGKSSCKVVLTGREERAEGAALRCMPGREMYS
jgi:hypothetical protein